MQKAEESGQVTCRDAQLAESRICDASEYDSKNTEEYAAVAGISKRQQKKLKRRAANLANQEAWREHQRLKKKINKENRKRKLEQEMAGGHLSSSLAKAKKEKVFQNPKRLNFTIDLSFEHLMTFREITSLCKQLCRCYSSNRKAANPFNLAFNGLSSQEQTKKRLSELYQYEGWDISYSNIDFAADPANVVYLTADSPHVITEFDPSVNYIIGGLIDKNRHKNLTWEIAQKSGIQTARLPIDDYVKLSSSKVMTINHVCEIINAYLDSKSWHDSFFSVIPQRKIQVDATEAS